MGDPFKTLETEPAFGLDLESLRARFLDASSRCHPDRFTDPIEQADAADQMSRLTEAYRVLRDPEARAHALLTRRGAPADADEPSLPPDLLMQMMEIREGLEQATASGDDQAVARYRDWALGQQSHYLGQISALFDEAASESNARAIRLQLNGLRYIVRMLEQMPDGDRQA